MGNKPSAPALEVGYVSDFTPDEVTLFTECCRPDHNRVKNEKNGFLGLDLFSDTGFISDTDDLLAIARRDDATVNELIGPNGHTMITQALMWAMFKEETLKENCLEFCPSWNLNRDDFEIKTVAWCGNQHCPFVKETTVTWEEDDETKTGPAWSKCQKQPPPCGGGTDLTVTNKKTGETIKFSTLMPHMIYFHHFYEGNVEHRVDPELAIRVFEIPKQIPAPEMIVI